jgi:hypothetical protein
MPYSPECVEEAFSEVRRSKLSRSGGGLGAWTGAKRNPSRSKRPGWLHTLPGFVPSCGKSQQPKFPRISYVHKGGNAYIRNLTSGGGVSTRSAPPYPHRTGSERYSPNVVEWVFSELRLNVLRSSPKHGSRKSACRHRKSTNTQKSPLWGCASAR